MATSAHSSLTSDFEDGIRLFKSEMYAESLKYFNRALDQGMQSPDLIYNLGSVHYKLQEYAQSQSYFELLTDDERYQGLAYYNLGLIANKQGDTDLAIARFRKSATVTSSARLRQLARKQIGTLQEGAVSPWVSFLSIGYGYDDNIDFNPTASVSNSDSFLRMLGYFEKGIYRRNSDNFLVTGTLFLTDYDESSTEDNDLISAGLEWRKNMADWNLASSISQGRNTYSGEDFLSTTEVGIRLKTRLGASRELRLGLREARIDNLSSEYAPLKGSRTRVETEIRSTSGRFEYRYRYRFEVNDRRDSETVDYSPDRHLLIFKLLGSYSPRISYSGSLSARQSRYGSIGTLRREDEQIKFSAEGKYQIDQTWATKLELQYTDNDSNVRERDYTKSFIQISVEALFL